jgi:hypothetical protein
VRFRVRTLSRDGLHRRSVWIRAFTAIGLSALLAGGCVCRSSPQLLTEQDAADAGPDQFGDEVHCDVPVDLRAIWALRERGATVQVERRTSVGSGGACHSSACLLLLPLAALSLAFPDHYDLASATHDGVEYTAAFATDGRFLWAVEEAPAMRREFGRVELRALGKRLLVEQRRFARGPDGRFTVEQPVERPALGDLVDAYRAVLEKSPDAETRGAVYEEAFESLGDQTRPLARQRFAAGGEPDAVLAQLIRTRRCLTEAERVPCAELFEATLTRLEPESVVQALRSQFFLEEHQPPRCEQARYDALAPLIQKYVWDGPLRLHKIVCAYCAGQPFEEAAAQLGATPVEGPPLMERGPLPPPLVPKDAALVKAVVREACGGPRIAEASVTLRAEISPWPARKKVLEDQQKACPAARWPLVLHSAGLSDDVPALNKALIHEGPGAAAWLKSFRWGNEVESELMTYALERGSVLEPELLAALYQDDRELTPRQADAVAQAFARAEVCHQKGACPQALQVQVQAIKLLGIRPTHFKIPSLPIEDRAMADILPLLNGEGARKQELLKAIAAATPHAMRWADDVESRADLLRLALTMRACTDDQLQSDLSDGGLALPCPFRR